MRQTLLYVSHRSVSNVVRRTVVIKFIYFFLITFLDLKDRKYLSKHNSLLVLFKTALTLRR